MSSAPDLTPDEIERLFALVAGGMTPTQAAAEIGVARQCVTMRKRRDPEFARRMALAEESLEAKLEAHVVTWAEKDWRAAMAILERKWPKRWARPEARALAKQAAGDEARMRALIADMLSKRGGSPPAPSPEAA